MTGKGTAGAMRTGKSPSYGRPRGECVNDHRKVCKRCGTQVRIIDHKLVLFFCQKHGTLRWFQVTHATPKALGA